MDQKQLKEKIAEYYLKLPPSLQTVFHSMEWLKEIENISEKYYLDERQKEVLATETTLVLLCILNIYEYEEILKNDLRTPQETLIKIISDVNNLIIDPIKQELNETFVKNSEDLYREKYQNKTKIDEHFNQLSEDIKKAINESDYQIVLSAIAQKYNLTFEQTNLLEEITTKTMLGVIDPKRYEGELRLRMHFSEEKMNSLINDVNENIFKEVRERMKEFWGEGERASMPKKDIPLQEKLREEIEGQKQSSQEKEPQITESKENAEEHRETERGVNKEEHQERGAPRENFIREETKTTENEEDDIVPRPPYSQMLTSNQMESKAERLKRASDSILITNKVPKSEEEIYTNSGIEIMKDREEEKNYEEQQKEDPYRENL